MHKQTSHNFYLWVLALLGMAFFLATPMTATAQVSKDEARFWKKKAKMYKRNPMSLKAEFENYQQQIEDLKAQVKDLMESGSSGPTDEEANLRMRIIELENDRSRLQSENEKLRRELASTKQVSEMGIRSGLVYRVQLVAAVLQDFDSPNSASDDVVVERSDGYNKFLIGGFRTYDKAQQFREEVRLLGFEDAWIVPYIDGKRVTIDEANQYRNSEGQASFLDNR
jgi:hypothetical protein